MDHLLKKCSLSNATFQKLQPKHTVAFLDFELFFSRSENLNSFKFYEVFIFVHNKKNFQQTNVAVLQVYPKCCPVPPGDMGEGEGGDGGPVRHGRTIHVSGCNAGK